MPRGRRPKPTKLKLLAGNPGRHKLNDREPQPAPPSSLETEAPPVLLPAARAEWDRIYPELVRLGTLSTLDLPTLAGYCQAYARWQDAEAKLTTEGSVVVMRDDKGAVKWTQPSPYVGIAAKWLDKWLRAAVELGHTPSSRSRVKGAAESDKPKGKLAALRRGA